MSTLIVVSRDAKETYEHLEATWVSKLGTDVTLMWDRRADPSSPLLDDRGEMLRGEHIERRRRPPAIWGTLGFLVVRDVA